MLPQNDNPQTETVTTYRSVRKRLIFVTYYNIKDNEKIWSASIGVRPYR